MNTDIYVERDAAEVTVAHTDLAIRVWKKNFPTNWEM